MSDPASAFDPDDGVYRLTTPVQMAGVLALAAGVPAAIRYAVDSTSRRPSGFSGRCYRTP